MTKRQYNHIIFTLILIAVPSSSVLALIFGGLWWAILVVSIIAFFAFTDPPGRNEQKRRRLEQELEKRSHPSKGKGIKKHPYYHSSEDLDEIIALFAKQNPHRYRGEELTKLEYLLRRIGCKKDRSALIEELENKYGTVLVKPSERRPRRKKYEKKRDKGPTEHNNEWKGLPSEAKNYIRNFVGKYTSLSSLAAEYELEDFNKLRDFLRDEGYKFSEQQLEHFIHMALFEIREEKLRKRFPLHDMNNLLRNYAKAYPEGHYIMVDIVPLTSIVRDIGEEKTQEEVRDALYGVYDQIERERGIKEMKKSLSSKKKDQHTTLSDLDAMNGHEFEKFLEKLFVRMDYEVTPSSFSRDQGVDLIISKSSDRIAVQAKRYSNPVGVKAVQEVVAAMKPHNCNRAMVVTTDYFTPDALKLAAHYDMELWDRSKLKKQLD